MIIIVYFIGKKDYVYHQFDTIVYPNFTSEAAAKKRGFLVSVRDFIFKSNQADGKKSESAKQEFSPLPPKLILDKCLCNYLEKCKKSLLNDPFDGYLQVHRICTSLSENSKGEIPSMKEV